MCICGLVGKRVGRVHTREDDVHMHARARVCVCLYGYAYICVSV